MANGSGLFVKIRNTCFETPLGHMWICDPHYASKLVPVGTVSEIIMDNPSVILGDLGDQVET